MTFKKSMSLILVLTMVLGLFSTGVFVNQAQASETQATTEAALEYVNSIPGGDMIPADGYVNKDATAPDILKYYLAADLGGTRYYLNALGTVSTAYGMPTVTDVAAASPVTLAKIADSSKYRIAFWSPSDEASTNYMCIYANSTYTASRTRLNGTAVLKDFTLNADGTFAGDIGTGKVLVCYEEGGKVYMGFVLKTTVEEDTTGKYAYVRMATTIQPITSIPESDTIPADSYANTNDSTPDILKYYLMADLGGTRYYMNAIATASNDYGMQTVTDVASATRVTLAEGTASNNKNNPACRIAFWSPNSAATTNYMCLYGTSKIATNKTRLNKNQTLSDFTLKADGTFWANIGTGRVLVCYAEGSTVYMGFVLKTTVDADTTGKYAYVHLAAAAKVAPLANEAPEGYKVSGNLPLGVGDQVNNLYAGANVNGTFNVISGNSSASNGMRYFPVTSTASDYPTSSVAFKPGDSEGYAVIFGKTDGTKATFAWDGGNYYFTNNGITDGIPSGGFAAKHSFSYDPAENIFTHTSNGMTYILGMKASDSGIRTYTYAEAIMAAATADTTDDIFPLRLYEKVSTIRYNVQLNSVLRVKFYVPTAEAEGMTVTVGGTAVTATANGTQTIGETEHAVYYVDVMAQDMLKPIVATVSNGNTKTFTLKNYVAELAAIGSDETVNNLAEAAFAYCNYAAANKYPAVYTAAANVAVPEGALSDYTITKAEGSDANIGLNAYLDEACDLQLLFPESYANYTVTVDGEAATLTTKTIGDTTYYVAKISGILPQDYGTAHTFVVKNGDETVYEAEASVLAYINHCLTTETGTEAELNLMSAMFHYWYDAVTYTTGSTPESLQLEAFTIVADSANAELANTLAANIQAAHGVTLAVNTSGSYTGNRAIYLGTDTSYNSYDGYRYNISIQNGSIYVNGTKEALATGANALVSNIQNTNLFPFGLEEATGYEWYNTYNTDNSVLRTPLGYTLKSYERMADLAPGVEMYKLTYTSPNTVSRYCISCGRSVLFDGEACNGCGTVKPNYKTAVAYAVVLRSGSDAKFQMVTAGYDPTKTYSTTDPAPTMTVQNLAAKLESDHSEYQVLAITNGGFARHDEGAGTEVPWGMQIVDGIVKHAPMTAADSGHARSQRWFGVNSSGKYKVGDAGDSNADRRDYTGIQQGVNGSHYIFKNGRPTPFLLTATQDDHTMVCHTKNDDMILLTMTNCNAAMATQAFMDLSQIAGNLDIYEGINLDGGGSTGMYYAAQGSSLSAAYVSNKDGQAREVSDAVAIVIPKN